MRPTRLGAIAALTAAAFIAIEIWLTGAMALLTRPLWLDEIHTLVVADRGNLFESMQALRAGAETNAPTLFLLYRAVGALTGGLSELPMRLVATVSVIAALSLVYLLLRDELGEIAAVGGVLSLWAQPVIVNVAFNARFYGPWLAAVAGLLYVLRRAVTGPWTWRAAVSLGVLSALVCAIHYFGILSWVMALTMAAALGRRSMPTVARRLIPALAGPIALGACLPIYFGQRAALTNATWVPAASLADHAFLLVTSFAALGLLVALGAWGASRALRRVAPANAAPPSVTSFGVGSWLLLSQMGVAFAVVLVSLLVQPATQPRYWIPASLAVAPLTALAVSRSLRPLQFAAIVATLVASFTFVAGEGADARAFARQVSADSTYAVRVVNERSTLVARRRHTLYPLLRAYPAVASNAILFGGPSIGRDSNLVAMDVRIARVHERFYGFPHIASATELEKIGAFYFLEVDSARSPSSREFPGRLIEKVAARLFMIRLP